MAVKRDEEQRAMAAQDALLATQEAFFQKTRDAMLDKEDDDSDDEDDDEDASVINAKSDTDATVDQVENMQPYLMKSMVTMQH